jgi:hypothetical protein
LAQDGWYTGGTGTTARCQEGRAGYCNIQLLVQAPQRSSAQHTVCVLQVVARRPKPQSPSQTPLAAQINHMEGHHHTCRQTETLAIICTESFAQDDPQHTWTTHTSPTGGKAYNTAPSRCQQQPRTPAPPGMLHLPAHKPRAYHNQATAPHSTQAKTNLLLRRPTTRAPTLTKPQQKTTASSPPAAPAALPAR